MNLLRNLFSTKNTGKGGVKSGRSLSANRMSCCDGTPPGERLPGTGCCGTSCAGQRTGCTASEPRIRTCLCQTNVGCLDRPDCGGFRPRGTAETGACPGPCQCEVEDSWNRNVPPKPNCEWVSNFSELRRQWSDHGRRESCKCCNCCPSRPSTPCRPCLPCPPATPCCSSTSVSYPKRDPCKPPLDPCARNCCESSRLGGGACQPCCTTKPPGCCPSPIPSNNKTCCPPPPNCCPLKTQNFCPSLPDCCPSKCESDRSSAGCCPPSSCSSPCSLPLSCQPCTPQPRPILKKRSCCLCAPSGCMCQPMPRNCNCPPPIQIDARADAECSCDCPSTPECACPPSERRFSRTKVKCPNARMCCPLPRLPPGTPCCCTECRPCLPPPCDPCSSSRCCSPTPRFKFCRPSSPCPPCSPCRPQSPVRQMCPARPSTPCSTSPCRKPPGQSPCRSLARTSSRGSSCCSPCRAPGQSSPCCDDNGEVEAAGCGDDDRERDFDFEIRSPQCRCGPDGKGCADDCDWCCSENCADRNDPVDPEAPINYDDRVPSVTQLASVEKLPPVNPNRVESYETNLQAPFKPQLIPTAGNAAVKPPGTLSTHCASGWNGSYRIRRMPCPTARIPGEGGTALPFTTRKTATPAINRTPIGTNALFSRRVVKRRSGLGGHDRIKPAAGVQPKVCDGVVPPVGGGDAEIPLCPCVSDRECSGGGYDLFSYLGDIGHSILVPGPLTLISFGLLILVAVTWAFGLALYHRCLCVKKISKDRNETQDRVIQLFLHVVVARTANRSHKSMIPREMKRHKILVRDAKSTLRHSCSPSERENFSSYFRNRDLPEKEYLLRKLSTHSAPRSIANISWLDRKTLSRLQSSILDRKHHLSPAELALAFFAKVEKLRSRRKTPRSSPYYCAACWSQSLPITSSRKKHFSLYQSISPASSCSDVSSQTSACTGKSSKSEPPMPSSRSRYFLTRQASKSQCSCGRYGRGCAIDCEFCCAFNCARVKFTNSKEAGLQFLDPAKSSSRITHIDGKIECRSTSNCKIQMPTFDDKYQTHSLERMTVPSTRDTGVCTESESRHTMLRDLGKTVVTDHRDDRVPEIPACNSKGSFRKDCGEKIVSKGKATPHTHDVHDKILVENTRDFHKHNVHDAATDNIRDVSRLISHDKAVGNDRDINRYDYHDLRRDNAKNVSRHNLYHEKGVGSVREASRHVYYKNDAGHSRGNSEERKMLNSHRHFGPDVSLRSPCHIRDHSTDRVVLEIARNKARDEVPDRKTRDRECHKPRIKVRDKITVKNRTNDDTKFSSCENSDSGSRESVQNRRNAKAYSSMKRSGSSKMSFVLGDKPRHFSAGISDRSIVTDTTSDSFRDSSRYHGHVSRKK